MEENIFFVSLRNSIFQLFHVNEGGWDAHGNDIQYFIVEYKENQLIQ